MSSKYQHGDIVKCVSVTPENKEGLVLDRFYRVRSGGKDGSEMRYAVQDMVDGDITHSIDRFEFVGRTLDNSDMPKKGDRLLCVDSTGCGNLTSGNIYEVEGCRTLLYVRVKGDNMSDIYSKFRFMLVEDKVCQSGNGEPEVKVDMVNHPNHYTQYRVEVIDIIEDATKGMDGFQGLLLGNVIKYVLRFRFKNGIEDLKKARFYLDRLITAMEK